MRTCVHLIPGIAFVGWVDADKLTPDITLRGIAHMPVPVLTEITEITVFDDAKCECVTNIEGTSTLDTASLKFTSDDSVPKDRHIAFVVTDHNGKSYIIGAREAPYPIVKRTRMMGVRGGDSAVTEYDISHTAIRSLIECDI